MKDAQGAVRMNDRWKIAPEANCEFCCAEIYKGDRRYFFDGKWMCEECFKNNVIKNPVLLANSLGVEVELYAG